MFCRRRQMATLIVSYFIVAVLAMDPVFSEKAAISDVVEEAAMSALENVKESATCKCSNVSCYCDFRIDDVEGVPEVNSTGRIEFIFELHNLSVKIIFTLDDSEYVTNFGVMDIPKFCIPLIPHTAGACLRISDFQMSKEKINLCLKVGISFHRKIVKEITIKCLQIPMNDEKLQLIKHIFTNMISEWIKVLADTISSEKIRNKLKETGQVLEKEFWQFTKNHESFLNESQNVGEATNRAFEDVAGKVGTGMEFVEESINSAASEAEEKIEKAMIKAENCMKKSVDDVKNKVEEVRKKFFSDMSDLSNLFGK